MPLKRHGKRGRWPDLWWEILVGLLIVWGGIWLAWYAPQQLAAQVTRAIFGRWGLVVGVTAVWTVLIIQSYWSLRRLAAFWGMALASLVCIAASACVWFPGGAAGGAARAVYFGLPGGAEFAAFAFLVYRKFHVLPRTKN